MTSLVDNEILRSINSAVHDVNEKSAYNLNDVAVTASAELLLPPPSKLFIYGNGLRARRGESHRV